MEQIDRSLKALFATGLFADVKLVREGNTLIVRVVENPIINRIAFEGNSKISDKDLNAEVQARARVVYTRTRVQNDVRRIIELYRRQGRFAATVEPKIIQLPENRVDVVFEINEGPPTGIRRINFVGNRSLAIRRYGALSRPRKAAGIDSYQRRTATTPTDWTTIGSCCGDSTLTEGYADFRVVSAVAELTPDRNGFSSPSRSTKASVTVSASRGQHHDQGPAARSGAAACDRSHRRLVRCRSRRELNLGFDRRAGKPRLCLRRNQAEYQRGTVKTAQSTSYFDVQEGPQVYVERIDIAGNVRTLDKVIRREFRLVEGDAFNTTTMQRSQERIKNLGFFKKGRGDQYAGIGSRTSTVVIGRGRRTIDRRAVVWAVGFSSHGRSACPMFNIRERNFLGRGQDLRIGTVLSLRSQQVDLSFTEPYFLDRNIAAGFDLFAIKTSPDAELLLRQNSALSTISYGGALRTGIRSPKSAPDPEIHGAFRQHHHICSPTRRCSLFCKPGSARPPRSARCCSTIAGMIGSSRAAAICFARQRLCRRGLWGRLLPQQGQCRLLLFGRAGVGPQLYGRSRLYFRLGRRSCPPSGPLFCRRRQSARLPERPVSDRATSCRATRSADKSIIWARSRSASRSAYPRSSALAGVFLRISARCWSTDVIIMT